MKKVAIVGFGFMGRTHFASWRRTRGAKVFAICDCNLAQLKNRVKGNGNSAAEDTDFAGVKIFADFGEMLKAGGFDIVDITLPTALHPKMTQAALEAGYDVLCEKPMALNAKAAAEMAATARRCGRKLMIAQCLRFSSLGRFIKRLIDGGKYGAVTAFSVSRISMTPGWSAGKSWFLDEEKSGGVALDLHIHDSDLVHFLFGRPQEVSSRMHWSERLGAYDHITTAYKCGGAVVTAEGNWGATKTFVFESNIRIVFDRAVFIYDTKREHPFTIFPEEGKAIYPKIADDEYDNEIRSFLDYVNGKIEVPFSPEEAAASVAIVDAEKRSARLGRPVKIPASAPVAK